MYRLSGVWRRRGPRGAARFLIGGGRRALRKLLYLLLPHYAARRRRADFRRCFAALERHQARYLTIGGTGMALNGLEHPIRDLDFLIDATPENAGRILAAVRDSGFVQTPNIAVGDLLTSLYTIFNEHIQVDVLSETEGICFAEAWERRRVCSFDGVAAIAAAPLDIIANKNAYRRPKDLRDIDALLDLVLGI